MAMCCQSNSTFLIFAVIVVWWWPCRRYKQFLTESFFYIYLRKWTIYYLMLSRSRYAARVSAYTPFWLRSTSPAPCGSVQNGATQTWNGAYEVSQTNLVASPFGLLTTVLLLSAVVCGNALEETTNCIVTWHISPDLCVPPYSLFTLSGPTTWRLGFMLISVTLLHTMHWNDGHW